MSIWLNATLLSGGLTPLHTAVLSHNKVLKDLKDLDSPCLYVVMQRKRVFVECIQTLLLMGASLTTKVTVTNTYFLSDPGKAVR